MNFFDAVLQAVNTLVQQNLGIFDGMGQNLFRAFATILVVWYGIKASLAAGEHRGGFHFANFVALILMISFGFGMVNYYDAPIPGFGRDFHHQFLAFHHAGPGDQEEIVLIVGLLLKQFVQEFHVANLRK